MTNEIGALDTQTSDVLLGCTEKAVMHQLLKPRHMVCSFEGKIDHCYVIVQQRIPLFFVNTFQFYVMLCVKFVETDFKKIFILHINVTASPSRTIDIQITLDVNSSNCQDLDWKGRLLVQVCHLFWKHN